MLKNGMHKSDMLKTSAFWLNRILWTVIVLGLVLVASYVSLGRYYIHYVEQYQQQLVRKISDTTGLSISIGHLYGEWSKLAPVITAEQFKLDAPAADIPPNTTVKPMPDTVLSIGSVSVEIDPLRSLLSQSLQIKNLYLDLVDCTLEEMESGQWQLKGFKLPVKIDDSKTPLDLNAMIDLLMSVKGAAINQALFRIHHIDGSQSLLTLEELSLQRNEDFRRIKLLASLDESEQPIVGVIESSGDPRDQQNFTGKAYLKLDNVDFSSQLSMLKAYDINLQQAEIDGEVWIDWKPQTRVAVQGAISIPYIDLAAISDKKFAPIEDLHFEFLVEKNKKASWEGWVPELGLHWQDQGFLFQELQIGLQNQQLKLALPELDLARLNQKLLALDVIPENLKSVLEELSPYGKLGNLHIDVSINKITERLAAKDTETAGVETNDASIKKSEATEEGSSRFRGIVSAKPDAENTELFTLRANLAEVGLEPWKGAPGTMGVSGFIKAGPSAGVVELEADAMSLSLPQVYESPLEFLSARGQVEWHLQAKRVIVDSSPVYVTTDHGPATVLLDLDLPMEAEAEVPPSMDLTVGITETDAAYRKRYIPSILNDDLRDWLDRSIKQGLVTDGGIIYRGSLRKDDEENRTVQLYFNVQDGELDYHQDWPALETINGLVLIDDADISVRTSRAKIYDFTIQKAIVKVAPHKQGGMLLSADIDASGSASEALNIVNGSVINDLVKGAFANWELEGKAAARIKLGIPLAGLKLPPDINVDVQLTQASLSIPDFQLHFDHLNGPLMYSHTQGVSSPGIKAELFNKALTAKVSQSEEAGVLVDLSGSVSMQDVQVWSRQPALTFTQGETEFLAQVKVSPDKGSEFSVLSDLSGVEIDLPLPFAKTAAAERRFQLRLPIGDERPVLTMTLAEQAQLELVLEAGSVSSGLVVLGDALNRRHETGLLTVVGAVEHFILDQWQPVLKRYQQAEQQLQKQLDANGQGEPVSPLESALISAVDTAENITNTEKDSGLKIKLRDMRINTFTGFDQTFENTLVNALRRDDSWWLSFSNEQLQGELTSSDDATKPLALDLDYLKLSGASASPEETAEEAGEETLAEATGKTEEAPLDIGRFADLKLDIVIDQLFLDETLLGNLSLDLRVQENTQGLEKVLRAENISLDTGSLSIQESSPALLEWKQNDNGQSTRFSGQLNINNIADTLKQWNYERILETKNGTAVIDLSWPGSPDQWDLSHSQGTVSVKLNNGRFLKASDTASGTLKVVGIINLTNILRRIQLDFSDLYKKGISFDRLEGTGVFSGGQLSIKDELLIQSPSSKFGLRGKADMNAKALDMDLVVTLPVANNLPWLAALAGGLPTAAGVYVASKIFEDQVNRFSSAVYEVKGDWNDPELKFKRVFDDSKSTKAKNASGNESKTKPEDTGPEEKAGE